MRIYVCSQEIIKEVKLVEKVSENGIKHYGIRVYLASPGISRNTPDDDDRSAVTFWMPNCVTFTPLDLASVFNRMTEFAFLCGQLLEEGERKKDYPGV